MLAGAAQEEAFRSHIDGMDTGGARVRLSSEPVSRNTAPAIALGAMRALDLAGEEDDEDADVVVAALPSDHFVGDGKEFKRALSAAVSAAKKGFIAVIGVQPTRPETGYGYIKRGAAAGAGVFNVGGFTEKPDAETAAGYVEDGFLWNCGIFVFRARVMIDEIKKHAPEVFAAVRGAVSKQDSYGLPDRQRYVRSPDISIDYAVMEKTDLGAVVPAGFEWSDVGSWRAVYDILKKGKGGNVVKGDAVVENSEDCLVLAGGGRLVAAGGLKDIAVVDEGDALLVADMNSPESVKALATRLAADKRPEAFLPAQREYKWGAETEIESGEGFSVRGGQRPKRRWSMSRAARVIFLCLKAKRLPRLRARASGCLRGIWLRFRTMFPRVSKTAAFPCSVCLRCLSSGRGSGVYCDCGVWCRIGFLYGRGGRVVEGARLLSEYTSQGYQGFESLPLRQVDLQQIRPPAVYPPLN